MYHHYRSAYIHAAVARILTNAQTVADWVTANGKKTKVMLIGSLPYVTPIDMNSLPPVFINGTIIKYVDRVKKLGVWITPKLNWNLHRGYTQSKVYSALKFLNFHRRSFSFEMKK